MISQTVDQCMSERTNLTIDRLQRGDAFILMPERIDTALECRFIVLHETTSKFPD